MHFEIRVKEIYLDNAATTPCDGRVLRAMASYWSKAYGNPSSFNDAGREAKKAVDEARKKIALILGAKPQEIIFTSSATEANNLAIFGTARASPVRDREGPQRASVSNGASRKPGRFIATEIEHHSVLEPIREIEKEGHEVRYLAVSKEGLVNPEELKKAITPKTTLLSIIYANNEVGSVQPIKKIAKIIKEFKNRPLFHIDAAQAENHLDLNVNNLGVDLMTLSSHKIYGPKGIAALYIRQGTKIKPLIFGGGQERGLRSSTEAVPLIVGFAKALELAKTNQELRIKNQEKLREYFTDGLKKISPEVKINGPENPKERVPHIINATFKGIKNEQILLYLDKYGIRASAGSACASREIEPSHVLRAIGLSKEEARSTVRFSLGRQTKKEDIDYVLKTLPKVINKIKKIYHALPY